METLQDGLGKTTNQTINSQGHTTEHIKVEEVIFIPYIASLSLPAPFSHHQRSSQHRQHLAEISLCGGCF